MNGFVKKLISLMVCGAMIVPIADAQHRPGTNGGRTSRTTQQQHQSRPSNSPVSRPSTGGSQGRPGNSGNHNGNNTRPGNGNNGTRPGNNNGTRPGNGNGNNGVRPGNSGNNHRPDNGVNDNRPGNSGIHRPGTNHGGVRPGVNPGPRPPQSGNHGPEMGYRPNPGPRPPHVAPPSRPYRPSGFSGPFSRPLPPPPGWRPRPGVPVINGILGLTFGTAIGLSLDYLFNNGYTIDGYGNDMVYLRNVPALNFMWTDATLYYGNAGGLNGSSFYYSTPYYDLARYNAVYNSLVATYGVPVAVNNGAGAFYSTWYGGNNGFITLRFNAQATMGGSVRYFTTLSFGN